MNYTNNIDGHTSATWFSMFFNFDGVRKCTIDRNSPSSTAQTKPNTKCNQLNKVSIVESPRRNGSAATYDSAAIVRCYSTHCQYNTNFHGDK